MKILGVVFFVACLTYGTGDATAVDRAMPEASCKRLDGRYAADATAVIYIENFGGRTSARPILWGAFQPLRTASPDHLVVTDRPARSLHILRDSKGCIASMDAKGFDHDAIFQRELPDEFSALELLLLGHSEAALSAFQKTGIGVREVTRVVQQILTDKPSALLADRAFAESAVLRWPDDAFLRSTLGELEAGTGQRQLAIDNLRLSLRQDPTNLDALAGLQRLHALPPELAPKGVDHGLSFSVDALFRGPDAAELVQARRDWTARNLQPKRVQVLYQTRMSLPFGQADVTMISYDVHGTKNVGAIVIPRSGTGPRGVILDIKSVDPPYYSPVDINDTTSFRVLGSAANRFAYLIPALQGEALQVAGKTFASDGDHFDAWDGAADSSIALLNAARIGGKAIDESRVCSLGMSRGAGVALLVGERTHIKCVAAISAPTDWFTHMDTGYPIWTTAQEISATINLPDPTSTKSSAYWFYQWFLGSAFNNGRTLSEVREKMIQSSPLFFNSYLPDTQVHYGLDDNQVPPGNGYALASQMRNRGAKAPKFSSFFYKDAGHDTNVLLSNPRITRFVESELEH